MAGTIDIQDSVMPILLALSPALRRDVPQKIGSAVTTLFQEHIGQLPDNRNNWPSTGFWAQCVKSCNYNVLAEQVNINVNWQGFRQRLQGGKIEAQNSGWLTIPARAEAYGKRAREFSNLEAVFFKTSHGFFGALVESDRTEVSFGKQRKDGSRKVKRGEERSGVMFWLKKSVRQQPNPNIIPSDDKIAATATQAVDSFLSRLKQRNGDGSV
jgi:hypothetical protein